MLGIEGILYLETHPTKYLKAYRAPTKVFVGQKPDGSRNFVATIPDGFFQITHPLKSLQNSSPQKAFKKPSLSTTAARDLGATGFSKIPSRFHRFRADQSELDHVRIKMECDG